MKSKNITVVDGKFLEVTSESTAQSGTTAAPKTTSGQNVDGFFRASQGPPVTAHSTNQKISVLAAPAPAPKRSNKPDRNLNHAHAHKPDTPKTLMRSAVKRPTPSFKQQTSIQGSLQHKVPSLVATKKSVSTVDPYRLSRAASVERSPHVARHHNPSAAPLTIGFAPLPVQAAPEKPTETGAPAPQHSNKPIDIFEHALANAGNFVDMQAHASHFKKQARKHFTSMTAGALALLVIAGFAAYQNTPGLQFKVASLQAGVATRMPNFQAAGFAYNGARATNGKLVVGFRGTDATYQMTQQATNWSDSDMIQNISSTDAGGNPNYTTVNSHGVNVYKLSNNSATWVSGGKWYQVTGTRALSDNQLSSLVSNI